MADKRSWQPLYSADFVYSKHNLFLKFAVDKLLASLSLISLSPALLCVVMAILAEAIVRPRAWGPPIVADRRISEGRPFSMYKFRTYFIHDDPLHRDKEGTTDFINDRDVTWVGAVLRKVYVDELPQLVNILIGDMSFVGPRPVPAYQYRSTLKQGYQAKRVLRAGLAGPVQALKGRWSEVGAYLAYDEDLIGEYLTRSSLGVVGLDTKICGLTLKKVFEADGLESPGRK